MNAAFEVRPRLGALIIAISSLMLLSGCVSKDMTDLENYASEVLARKGGKIEPLPPIKPYERYLYRSGELDLRDPFKSFAAQDREDKREVAINDEQQREFANEILTHNPEELEGYELDTLRMVGTMENPDNMWAIIRDPQKIVHRVQVGNYMGRNFGKITNIQDDRIDVREIIQDSQGRYEERAATIALAEE